MTQLLQNAVYGAALILALAVLRRILKDRLIPEARLALWAVCLFRLLTPVSPESALSLWGLFTRPQAAPVPGVPAPAGGLPVPSVGTFAPGPQTAEPAAFPWGSVLPAVWIGVGLALAARYALSYVRTRRALARTIPVGRDDPRYGFLPRGARLREGTMEGAPLTFGAARPTVVLPPGLSGGELACVLAHEGVHVSRRDNLWHYAMALALVLHWWNPAVWLMGRLLRRDIELACDRAAVKKLGAERRADYANALVSLAVQGDSPSFCQTFGRKSVEERILYIMKFKKISVIGVVFSLALVLAVTVAFASAPKTPDAGTVEYHGRAYDRAGLSQETLDWLDWYLALSEAEQMAVSYEPAELRDGRTPSVADADVPVGEVGSEYYAYDYAPAPSGVAGGVVGIRTSAGAYDLCADKGCGVSYDHCHIDGSVVRVYYEDPGLLCAHPDCEIEGPHQHDGVQYAGRAGKFVILNPDLEPAPSAGVGYPVCAVDGCTLIGRHDHNGVTYCGGPAHHGSVCDGSCGYYPVCAVDGCTLIGRHDHNGVTYCGGSHHGGVCDGSCGYYPVCTVDGCTLTGPHDHNGVTYCGGSHHGGVCDGSCGYYSSQPAATAPSTGAGWHHGGGHHGRHH